MFLYFPISVEEVPLPGVRLYVLAAIAFTVTFVFEVVRLVTG